MQLDDVRTSQRYACWLTAHGVHRAMDFAARSGGTLSTWLARDG